MKVREHTHTRLPQKIQDGIDETFKLASELKRNEIKIEEQFDVSGCFA